MAAIVRCRCAYFGYSVEFDTAAGSSSAERRAEANAIILDAYGITPTLSYVEPGLPFPDYVPVMVWHAADESSPADWY